MPSLRTAEHPGGIKFHGKYCGPGWSDGRRQSSVVGSAPPEDELDALCKQHDAAYANGSDQAQADRTLVYEAPLSIKGVIIKGAVGAQLAIRETSRFITGYDILQDMTKKQNKPTTSKPTARSRAYKQLEVKTAAPVAVATRKSGSSPRILNGPRGNQTITHRQLLGPINCASSFSASAIPLNPGLSRTFPWLSKIARGYEKYRFRRISVEYRPVCATSIPGVVMYSIDFDPCDPLPTTKAAHSQSVPNTENNAWMVNTLTVPPSSEWRFVRAATLAPNLDLKTYDCGQIITSTCYGNDTITGELWIDYTVELRNPTEAVIDGCKVFGSGSVTDPFNSGYVQGQAPPCTISSPTTLTFDTPGDYIISWSVVTTTTGTMTLTPGNGGSIGTSTIAGQTTVGIRVVSLNVTTPGFVLTATATSLNSSTSNNSRMWIVRADTSAV